MIHFNVTHVTHVYKNIKYKFFVAVAVHRFRFDSSHRLVRRIMKWGDAVDEAEARDILKVRKAL